MTSRPLHAVLLPAEAAGGRLLEALSAALDGSGPAILPLDPDLPYATMTSLTIEARQKLAAIRPATLAQASGISGVSPSDLQNLLIEVERWRPASARELDGVSAD